MNHPRAVDFEHRSPFGAINIADVDRLRDQLDDLRAQLTICENGDKQSPFPDGRRLVREILRRRRRRQIYFSDDLFGEPAWDILLDLYAAELAGQKVSVSSACLASGVPSTTGLRWLSKLVDGGWIRREYDTLDGRRCWVFLTQRGISAMRKYVAEMSVRPAD